MPDVAEIEQGFEKLCEMKWQHDDMERVVRFKETSEYLIFDVSIEKFIVNCFVVEKETGRTLFTDFTGFQNLKRHAKKGEFRDFFEKHANIQDLKYIVTILEVFADDCKETAEFTKWRAPDFERVITALRLLLIS